MANRQRTDVLVIGSGAAGLATALHLADATRVTVLSKDALHGGATNRAQGGVAAVTDPGDSFESHVADTIDAGAGLCDEDVVRYAVERAPECIDHIVGLGVRFDREDNAPHLTREGGHSHRRVLHVADATGAAIGRTLIERAVAHPNIRLLSGRVAVDLVTARKLGAAPNRVLGAYVYDIETDAVEVIEAPFVVLATGGASKVYLYTSNPDGATGDGIAIAWRAGCRVGNMEFNQFHPTCLYHPEARSFLISEAVRGEGGKLLLADGSRFMQRFDGRGELASRDIVARAIDHEMKRLGAECVYLDISHRSADYLQRRFPTILAQCLRFGIDMRREPVPVVPAAHYTCGGVIVDLASRTDVPGLYAVGETAYTGLHGANRLASNSLLECLVFARAAAADIVEKQRSRAASRSASLPLPSPPAWDESRVSDSDEQVVLSHNWTELRRFMWDYVGIVRTNKRLERAQHRIDLLKREIHDYYARHRVSADLIELRNLVHVAELIVRSAAMRKESRGLHYTLDHPQPSAEAVPSVIHPGADPLDVLQPISAASAARSARRSLAKRTAS